MLTRQRTRFVSLLAALAVAVAGLMGFAPRAAADCSNKSYASTTLESIAGGATRRCDGDSNNGGNNNGGRRSSTVTINPDELKFRKWEAERDRIDAANIKSINTYRSCLAAHPNSTLCSDPFLVDVPAAPDVPAKAVGILVPAPPPEVVAYTALARLKLNPPKPVIGPPPNINPWKMAAVGYPLWLSVDANPNPPAATDEVLDLSVSIKARLSQVTFAMGEGKSVTCTDLTHVWKRHQVKPGTKSPTCGYTYEKPSLPRGKYTVTATSTWTVAVTINGDVVTIPYRQQSSTTLPVGELQVTVR